VKDLSRSEVGNRKAEVGTKGTDRLRLEAG
jgi:hypothetical protein